MARVFLVYFDIDTGFYPGLHHGLASLSAAIRQKSHALAFHHLSKEESPEALSDTILKFNPDIVGFSFTTNQRRYFEKYSKSIYCKSKVLQVVGGVHATVDPVDLLSMDSVQGVCIGEGERTFPDLLRKIDTGDSVFDAPGFWWRTKEGIIKQNPIPPLDPDLSKLPYPDYSIFNTNEINEANGGWMVMLITRGCPYNCSYCGNHAIRCVYPNKQDYVRVPPVEYAIGVIKNNLACYSNVKGIFFVDELLIWNKEWFKDFSEHYRCEVKLPFACTGRVEHLTEDICSALKRAGCILVQIGIECGNEWYREYFLNRRMSNGQIIKAFRLLKYFGIQRFSYSMLGLPFETKELMEETLSLNKRIEPEFGQVSYFFPYPGTRLYSICKDFGLLTTKREELSGYLEGPAINFTHSSVKGCKKIFYKLRLYLNAQVATKNLKFASRFISMCIYFLFNIYPSFFANLTTKRSKLQYILRKIGYKNIFVNR